MMRDFTLLALMMLSTSFFASAEALADLRQTQLGRLRDVLDIHKMNLARIHSYTVHLTEEKQVNSRYEDGKMLSLSARDQHHEIWLPGKDVGRIDRTGTIESQREGEPQKVEERTELYFLNESFLLTVKKQEAVGHGWDLVAPGQLPEDAEHRTNRLTAMSPRFNGFGNGDFSFEALCKNAFEDDEVSVEVSEAQDGIYQITFGKAETPVIEVLTVDAKAGALITKAVAMQGDTKSKELDVTPKFHAAEDIWFPDTWEVKYFAPGGEEPSMRAKVTLEKVKFNSNSDEAMISLATLDLEPGRMLLFTKADGVREPRIFFNGQIFSMGEYEARYPDAPIYREKLAN